ncbi:MAG: hypothetical protein IJ599_04450 [Alphaproteobacteria bacterium]|nr:hypothetical protein [Alphaproteobacteria bacterium]
MKYPTSQQPGYRKNRSSGETRQGIHYAGTKLGRKRNWNKMDSYKDSGGMATIPERVQDRCYAALIQLTKAQGHSRDGNSTTLEQCEKPNRNPDAAEPGRSRIETGQNTHAADSVFEEEQSWNKMDTNTRPLPFPFQGRATTSTKEKLPDATKHRSPRQKQEYLEHPPVSGKKPKQHHSRRSSPNTPKPKECLRRMSSPNMPPPKKSLSRRSISNTPKPERIILFSQRGSWKRPDLPSGSQACRAKPEKQALAQRGLTA